MTEQTSLPGVLAEIAELCGRGVALHIAHRFGGEKLHVPTPDRLLPEHPLALAVGRDDARRISQRFAGESVYVPLARRHLVVHLAGLGQSTREIATALSITRSTVRQYRRQGSMLP